MTIYSQDHFLHSNSNNNNRGPVQTIHKEEIEISIADRIVTRDSLSKLEEGIEQPVATKGAEGVLAVEGAGDMAGGEYEVDNYL